MSEATSAQGRLAEIMARRLAEEKTRVPPVPAFRAVQQRSVPRRLTIEQMKLRTARTARAKRCVRLFGLWTLFTMVALVAFTYVTREERFLRELYQSNNAGNGALIILVTSFIASGPVSAWIALGVVIWYWRALPWAWIVATASLIPIVLTVFVLLADYRLL